MSLSHVPAGLNSDAALREDLRALPLAAPSASAWPALEAALRANGIVTATPAPRRHWRWAVPAALAAGLALALLLPRAAITPTATPAPDSVAANSSAASAPGTATQGLQTSGTNVTAMDPTNDLDALRARSQRLETWLQRVAAGSAPLDGQNLMAAAEVEDLIGLVDVQLGGAGQSPEAAALWRQRIALLEDLGAIRSAAWNTNTTGLAANNGSRAVPATWIN